MKIDITTQILNLQGEPFKNGDNEDSPLTLRDVCITSLSSVIPKEDLDGVEKFKRYQLAQKIYSAHKEVTLTAEDISKIKELVGKIYNIPVVGAVYLLLEKEDNCPDAEK